ncbi:MAG TPA: glycerate kinase, partial [Acidimicrobiia bacterium]|nr:glycerate kinase [Acidimicrobiia bacterium]
MPHVVAAPDKFRGTATASQIAAAIEWAAHDAGWTCDRAPVADGGEGLLDVLAQHFGGTRRSTRVRGPLGAAVDAEWLLAGTTAVIEMARASGLVLAGGPEGNDPLEATTAGTGQLIAAAVGAGAKRIIVGLGGSATTDGGRGALDALRPHARIRGVELVVACDVTTVFVDAAAEFGPQKGASPAQVELLRRRLERLADDYLAASGVDVTEIPGAGAAGGLAGGLATLGATIVPGFDLVADLIDLPERIAGADLVVTGEGHLDEWSFRGKSVGGVVELADEGSVDVMVVAGVVDDGLPVDAISLVERCGHERAIADPAGCVAEIVTR